MTTGTGIIIAALIVVFVPFVAVCVFMAWAGHQRRKGYNEYLETKAELHRRRERKKRGLL